MKEGITVITVSVNNLVKAIREADAFRLPDMNAGTAYLYNDVYRRLAQGEDVKLSGIDFGAFEPEDVAAFSDLYSDVFENNHCAVGRIASALRAMTPASKAVGYV